jgi:hypothetical protein
MDWYTLDQLIVLHSQNLLRVQHENYETKIRETQESQNTFRNVHNYDGTLANPVDITYNSDIKQMLLNKVLIILDNPVSKMMASKIINEETVDNSNQISTANLLADILVRKMTIDIFLLLEEQLSDNYLLGQCPQGRSTRLLQIRNMLE